MQSKPKYTIFLRKDSNGDREAEYTYRFLNWLNQMVTVKTNIKDKFEAKLEAHRHAVEHHEIRIGTRPQPTTEDKDSFVHLSKHVDEYFDWGLSHGGKRSKPWDDEHCRKVKAIMTWWLSQHPWKTFYDINITDVESSLQTKSKETVNKRINGIMTQRQITGKTVNHYKSVICGFVNWYYKKYNLSGDNPLKNITSWDKSVTEERRDLSVDEVKRLLYVAPLERAIVYYVAIVTGLRRGELQLLEDANFDQGDSILRISSDNNKERRSGLNIQLPKSMKQKLIKYIVERGRSKQLFKFDFSNAVKHFDIDCKAAGIPKTTQAGKLVFHSLRDTHVNMGIDVAEDIKTAMEASRHNDPKVFIQKYAKRKEDRVTGHLERIDDLINDDDDPPIAV